MLIFSGMSSPFNFAVRERGRLLREMQRNDRADGEGEEKNRERKWKRKGRGKEKEARWKGVISPVESRRRNSRIGRASEVNRHRHEYLGGDEPGHRDEGERRGFVGECRSLGSPPIMRTSHLESNVHTYIHTYSFFQESSTGSFSSTRPTGGPPYREIRGKVGFKQRSNGEAGSRTRVQHVSKVVAAMFGGDRIIFGASWVGC